MRILHLIDSLDYSGAARQIQMLAPALTDDRSSVEICCLGRDTPWSTSSQQAGVRVHTLGWNRWFDFGALWNLREIVREGSFDVIHVWRLSALRSLAVVAKRMLRRVVMSAPLPADGRLAWWDRRLLQQVRCLAVAGASDAEHCVRLGIDRPALRIIPPVVQQRCQDPFQKKGPDTFFRIACVGRLERETGARQAIWTFDLIRHVYADAQLQLVGAGTQRPALHALAIGLECDSHVRFLGAHAEATDVLRDADVVWIPSQANTGRQVALEAMSQGRAVVASDVPCLREVVKDGETGYLAAVGDVVQFARRTAALLRDDDVRQSIGAAAREYVERQFPFDDTVQQWRDVYQSVAASDGPRLLVGRFAYTAEADGVGSEAGVAEAGVLAEAVTGP